MPFNSYIFVLAFLPMTVTGYFLLNKRGAYSIADVFLVCASLFFYGYFNPTYVGIFAGSILVNYLVGKLLHSGKGNRKALMIGGFLFNLGLLFVFKYYNFFISGLNTALGSSIQLISLMLPIGISFYTFQQIAYIVDNYKQPNMQEYSLLEYLKYVAFFPYILQGPIAYHHEIIPQFGDEHRRKVDFDNLAKGLWLFAIGMGKKVIIADSFGLLVDNSFAHIGDLGTIKAWITMFSYAMQIYFDFSGYSDMATGVAKMLNIDLPLNFNSPYKAMNISDFWKRWHMTLTRFFTKYVYIPLGGNRRGNRRTYINMLIVFLISGLWHGANWTFVLWGAAHGVASILTKILLQKTTLLTPSESILKRAVLWIGTFLYVNLTWVLFRANSITDACMFYGQLFSFNFRGVDVSFKELVLTAGVRVLKLIPLLGEMLVNNWLWILLACAFVLSIVVKNETARIEHWKPSVLKMCFAAGVLVYCILCFAGVSSFLYWNF